MDKKNVQKMVPKMSLLTKNFVSIKKNYRNKLNLNFLIYGVKKNKYF
jgi:hypothetical protein